MPLTRTNVAKSEGYISFNAGANTRSIPAASSISRSAASRRGYEPRSSVGANCFGLTKIDATIRSHSARAASISAICPWCNAPMVGTKPTRTSPLRQRAMCFLRSATVRTISKRRHSSFDRARGEAGDVMLDKEGIDDGDRDRAQQRARHQLAPIEHVAADQLGDDPDRHGAH